MRHRRSIPPWLALVVLGATAYVAAASGCEIIGGINEKTIGSAGDGGLSKVAGDPLCAPGIMPAGSCGGAGCSDKTAKDVDPCHCARCDHSCGGSTCQGSFCEPVHITDGFPYMYRIATNGEAIFLSSHSSASTMGGIYSLPLDPKAPEVPTRLSTDRVIEAGALAVDCSFVYFAGDPVVPAAGLFRVPVKGGAVEEISADEPGVSRIVTDGVNLYWISVNANSVGRVRMRYGASGQTREITGDLVDPSDIKVDGTFIYWSLGGLDQVAMTGSIFRATIPKETESPSIEMIVANAGHARALTLDEAWVYWLNDTIVPGTNIIMRKKKDGSGLPLEVASHPLKIERSIAVDAAHVYWISNEALFKRSKDGALPTLSITNPSNLGQWDAWATGFVIDRSRVYFVDTHADQSPVNWVAK